MPEKKPTNFQKQKAMYKLPEDERQKALSAIDRLQYQTKPLLAESVYNQAEPHTILLSSNGEIAGNVVSFVAVKGVNTWAIYFAYGQRSDQYLASSGMEASIKQALLWIDCEGGLIENYRA